MSPFDELVHTGDVLAVSMEPHVPFDCRARVRITGGLTACDIHATVSELFAGEMARDG